MHSLSLSLPAACCPSSTLVSFSSNQNDFTSTVMTHSGLSLEELRFVEGQGQSSEIITPSEELNRINDMGTAVRPSPLCS